MTKTYARAFPGRAALLRALNEAGGRWTARDVAAFARSNGGSEPTYAALAWYVRRGRITYTPNLWVVA